MPTKTEIKQIIAPGYAPPRGAIRECIGRLAFEAPVTFEWPTSKAFELEAPFNHRFSQSIFDRGDAIEIGNTSIGVMSPISPSEKSKLLDWMPATEQIRVKSELAEEETRVLELERLNDQSPRGREALRRARSRAATFKSRIARSDFEELVLNAGDAVGYATKTKLGAQSYSVLRAYLFFDSLGFAFESKVDVTDQTALKHQREEFDHLLKTFRPRKFGEVSNEIGVCIPHGFIPDDGMRRIEVKMSFRMADAPNVLYTIDTGTVHARALKPTVLNAIASASASIPGWSDDAGIAKYVTQRIGPRVVKMGGVSGEQGGIALRVKQDKNPPFEAYSVSTGYAGWLGTVAMPYMLVDMRTFTRQQAPELQTDPPPFSQSMERLDFILNGLRLRETSPRMPGLR